MCHISFRLKQRFVTLLPFVQHAEGCISTSRRRASLPCSAAKPAASPCGLPDWTYPVVCDVTTGELKFDNFKGQWGDQKELDRFLQAYAVEKSRLECRRRGHTLTEQELADGSIKLTIQVAGGAA